MLAVSIKIHVSTSDLLILCYSGINIDINITERKRTKKESGNNYERQNKQLDQQLCTHSIFA